MKNNLKSQTRMRNPTHPCTGASCAEPTNNVAVPQPRDNEAHYKCHWRFLPPAPSRHSLLPRDQSSKRGIRRLSSNQKSSKNAHNQTKSKCICVFKNRRIGFQKLALPSATPPSTGTALQEIKPSTTPGHRQKQGQKCPFSKWNAPKRTATFSLSRRLPPIGAGHRP